VDQVELETGKVAIAPIARLIQNRDRPRYVAVLYEKVQVAKTAQGEIAECLLGENRSLESNGVHSGSAQFLVKLDELIEEKLVAFPRLLNEDLECLQYVIRNHFGRGARQRMAG